MKIQTGDVFQFYRYIPSIPAAVIFICLFSTTTALHIYQVCRTKTWILLPLVLGGISEITGYMARIFSSKQAPDYSIGLFVMQSSPTLLAPALFAASIYMCLGRIMLVTHGQHLSLIPPKRLTVLFVTGDVLGLLIQGAGAVIMPLGTLQDYHNGANIVIAGLSVLVFSFGLFIAVALVFDYRMRKNPTRRSLSTPLNWTRDLRALYISSVLIFARSLFRLIEYSQGNDGLLIRNEWTLYVFDTVLMWSVLVLFNFYHPSHVAALLRGGRYCKVGTKGVQIVEIKVGYMDCGGSSPLGCDATG